MGSSANVRVDVDEGILDAGTDASAGSHVADPLGPLPLEDIEHEFFVADVSFVDCEALLVRANFSEMGKRGMLDLHVVVVVDLIDDDDIVPALEQVLCDVGTNESGASSYEDLFVPDVGSDLGAETVVGRKF